ARDHRLSRAAAGKERRPEDRWRRSRRGGEGNRPLHQRGGQGAVTVLVFCEVQGNKLKKASREALSIGRKLAEAAGGELVAFATDRAAADDAGRYGAKKLYVFDAGAYNTETYTAAMQAATGQSSASVVLLGGTSNGRDLAPRLAARLNSG